MRQAWEIWRYLGAAVAALMLGASQIEPNPLPYWVFPAVAILALATLLVGLVLDRHRD